jgi:signal transduction histidine kinase
MIFLNPSLNLDLLAIGVTVAAIGILGFVGFFSNPRSSTNRAFLALAMLTIAYSVTNYVSYQLVDASVILWVLRFTIFFAIWHAFSFFHFSYVFPKESLVYPKIYKWLLIPTVSIISLLTLSPLMFAGLEVQAGVGSSSQAILGPAIPLFGIATLGLVAGALFLIIKRTLRAEGLEKKQFFFILGGAALTFSLLIVFNLVLPIVFQQVRYIPLAAIFFFPFVAFTTYAILKHHLLSAKVVSTEILAFILAVVTFSEVVISQNLIETLFRSGEFVLVLIFGIFLIKSVLKEVQQREELQRLNQQIAGQNVQLQDLSRFKSQLLSLASHQIKSPLAAIKGFASLVADGSYGEVTNQTKEAIGKIQHSADDLLALINTLLDVRKVEEGKMEYKFERADITQMIAGVLDTLQPLAAAKNLELSAPTDKTPIWVNADPEKLKQVIQNLVDNAIKYTPSGFIKILLNEKSGSLGSASTIVVSVTDSGLGIPADLVPHLFEEFVRDERVKKEIRGTGLGLYIAKKIVEAHGGRIWAESPGEGKGSTFHIALSKIQ